MDGVQAHFRLGWRDLAEDNEDEREFQGFDAIVEKLPPGIEGMIHKIINVFKNRDITDLIDWCYAQTEPMLAARRGEALDFSTVPIVKEMPVFYSQVNTRAMPQLSTVSHTRIAAYREKAANLKGKARQWRAAMATPAYEEAMLLLAQQRQAALPDLHGRKVYLDENSVAALGELGHE